MAALKTGIFWNELYSLMIKHPFNSHIGATVFQKTLQSSVVVLASVRRDFNPLLVRYLNTY